MTLTPNNNPQQPQKKQLQYSHSTKLQNDSNQSHTTHLQFVECKFVYTTHSTTHITIRCVLQYNTNNTILYYTILYNSTVQYNTTVYYTTQYYTI
jgi:hypothetical protein